MADISTLQQSLINAKKVMNKVDGGNFERSGTPLSQPITENVTLTSSALENVDTASARQDLSPKSNMTQDKIKNSKLPQAIKEAMINNPIPDVPFNNSTGLSSDFVDGVKESARITSDPPVLIPFILLPYLSYNRMLAVVPL